MIAKTMVPAIKGFFHFYCSSRFNIGVNWYLPGVRYWLIINVSAYIYIFCFKASSVISISIDESGYYDFQTRWYS